MPRKGKNPLGWLVISLLILLPAWPLVAQDGPRISYHIQNKKLTAALENLGRRYHLLFAYDHQLIGNIFLQNVRIDNAGLSKALTQILSPHQLDFEIIDRHYILIKRQEGPTPTHKKDTAPMLCGILTDSLTGTGLPFANVLLNGTEKGAVSDEKGYFRLRGPFGLTDSLLIRYVGYRQQTIPVADLLRQTCPEIPMKLDEVTFEHVLIRDRAVGLLRTAESGNGTQFRPGKMGILPGWGDNDVLRMVQLLPGVYSTDESATSLHIRGGTPDQNLILWDRIPIYHSGHFFGMFSALNPFITEQVDVYRGGFGARFGGRISGVIDIQSKPSRLDSLEGGAGFNLINTHAYVKVPLFKGRSAMVFGGRRSFTDIIQSQTYRNLFNFISGDGKIEDHERTEREQQINLSLNPQLSFYDLNVKWVFQPVAQTRVGLSFYQGNDQLVYTAKFDQSGFFLDSRDRIEVQNWGMSAFWVQNWSHRFTTRTSLVLSEYLNDYNFKLIYRNPQSSFNARYWQLNRLNDLSIQVDNHWRIHPRHLFNFGYHYSRQQIDYQIQVEDSNSQKFQTHEEFFLGGTHTLYTDFDFHLEDNLSLDFGLRSSFHNALPEPVWEPRLAIDYRPFGPKWHLKGSIGRHLQFVRQIVGDNELGLAEQLWIMTDEEHQVPPMTATQFSGGVLYDSRNLLLEAEYYRKQIHHLASLSLRFANPANNTFSLGKAQIHGLDILIKKNWPHYTTWLSYTLARVRYHFEEINANKPFPASHDQRHTLNWTHLFQWKNWAFSLSWNYGSGRPYTEARGVQLDENSQPPIYLVEYGEPNQERLPPYHRLDASSHYAFHSPKKLKGKIGISVFNLYDRRNLFDKTFIALAPENETDNPKLFRYDRKMIGFTPNIFFQLEW